MKKLIFALGLLGGVYFILRALRTDERQPAWPSRKKRRHDARIAEARAREQAPARPAEVHVERDDDDALKVPIGEQTH